MWWTFIGFACRALVPVGYMPAALGEGGPFVLCHGGGAGAFLQSLTDHASDGSTDHAVHMPQHAHHGEPADGSDEFEAWELCPIGVAAGAGPVAADLQLSLLSLRFENPAPVADPFVLFASEPPYRSRAPPSGPIV